MAFAFFSLLRKRALNRTAARKLHYGRRELPFSIVCIDSPRLPPFFSPCSSSGYTYETFLILFFFFLISSFSLSLAAPRLQEEWSSMALICFRASGKRVWILIFFALRASVWQGLRFGLVARGKKEKRETHLKWTDGLSPFSQSAPTPVPGLAETHKAECGKSNRDPPPVRLWHRVRSHLVLLSRAAFSV